MVRLGLGRTWVVAVSGGSDSVGLLRVLHALGPELGLAVSVAHLDHGVRGEASRADAAFVEAIAGELGLPCDHGQWQPKRTSHFEADARRAGMPGCVRWHAPIVRPPWRLGTRLMIRQKRSCTGSCAEPGYADCRAFPSGAS